MEHETDIRNKIRPVMEDMVFQIALEKPNNVVSVNLTHRLTL
jgi:hypothetical protein